MKKNFMVLAYKSNGEEDSRDTYSFHYDSDCKIYIVDSIEKAVGRIVELLEYPSAKGEGGYEVRVWVEGTSFADSCVFDGHTIDVDFDVDFDGEFDDNDEMEDIYREVERLVDEKIEEIKKAKEKAEAEAEEIKRKAEEDKKKKDKIKQDERDKAEYERLRRKFEGDK